jgi:putative transposase
MDGVAAGDSPATDEASELGSNQKENNEGAPFLAPFARSGARPAPRVRTSSWVVDHRHRLCLRRSISNVPRNLKRYYGAGDLHFITCSCYHRQPWMGSASRRDLFLTVLEHVRQRYAFVILGYVVMPEHFHLLVSEPQRGTLSTVMKALKLGFARRVLGMAQRPDQPNLSPMSEPAHVWQRRFYDFNVWTGHKRIEKLRYMHRNPVKRGLVAEPDQWRWSSFRFYAYGEAGPVTINCWKVLEMKVRDAG